MVTFGSICSGIEAASVGLESLGFKPLWFTEISSFPCFLLSHKWPEIKNHGDITRLPEKINNREISAPDLLIGGTPCQSFSFSGLRKGLSDERGKLVISFVDIANAVDRVRLSDGKNESVILWENVKGVLSTKDNSFGCFLGLLSGEELPLIPPGGKWSNAGFVFGPTRSIAWRVLDAQYFGSPQRRKRVFVVASARKDFDPTRVLFESESVFGNHQKKSKPYPTIDCGVWRRRQSNQWIRNGFAIVRNNKVSNLTITEAERLQGFPDGYTDVPWKGNNILAERFAALGNTMNVNCITWLGKRLLNEDL